jgi:ATP-dependent DNA ligase
MPSRFIEPCLPSPADRPPSGSNWIHEIKHYGYRLMARRDPVGIRLITRRGNDWTTRFPLVVEAVNRLKVRSVLIDGEVVCCDERAIPGARVADHSPRRQSLRQSRKGAPLGKDRYRGRLLPATPRGEAFSGG